MSTGQIAVLLMALALGALAVPVASVLCYLPSALRISDSHAMAIDTLPCKDAGQAPIFLAEEAVSCFCENKKDE